MTERICWCTECGVEFPNECLFWKHYCKWIDDKAMGTPMEFTDDETIWERWMKQFLTYDDPYSYNDGNLVIDNDH